MSKLLRGEPVKLTCPDIDYTINKLKSIMQQMEKVQCEDPAVMSLLEDWMTDLYDIAGGPGSTLESLRTANAQLRDWGWEMHHEAKDLQYWLEKNEQNV